MKCRQYTVVISRLKILLSILLCSVLYLGVSVPSYGTDQAIKADVNVSQKVEIAITKSGSDKISVILELNDYTNSDLKNSSDRRELKNDQNDIIDDINLDADLTTKFSRFPLVATEITSDQLDQLKNDSRIKSISLQERYTIDDLKTQATLAPMGVQIPSDILNAKDAWNHSPSYTGIGQKIVILDSGIDKNHPYLDGAVVHEECFASGPMPRTQGVGSCPDGTPAQSGNDSALPCDSSIPGCYHGTHVAGIAAGRQNVLGAPSQAAGGVAPGASIIAIRVFGVYSSAPYSTGQDCGNNSTGILKKCILAENVDILLALQWIIANPTGVASVNMSLGGIGVTNNACDGVYDYYTIEQGGAPGLGNAVTSLKNDYKIATVVASGNGGSKNGISAPACVTDAIAVGSTQTGNSVVSTSNTGVLLSLFAPGDNILSSIPDDGYAYSGGTSMAAPAIAGAFALIKQAVPSGTVSSWLTRFQNSGTNIIDGSPSITRKLPNILDAINNVASSVPTAPGYVNASTGYGYAYLTWSSVVGANSYRIINSSGNTIADVSSGTTAYNVATIPYTNNYFAVRASNSSGSSVYKYSNNIVGLPNTSQVGYTFFASNGATVGFGSASLSTHSNLGINNVVGGSSNRYSTGAWGVSSAGDVYSYGSAGFYGSMGGQRLNKPMISIASTATSNGYWMVASDGGIFSFGDAQFYGSTGSIRLNKPVVGMAPTPSGNGYWMVASDGGIFSFGDAQFYGSTGSINLNRPIVGMTPTPSGNGYWLVASDGGIFAFGDAQFAGSLGGLNVNDAIGMKRNDSGTGYWIFRSDGSVYSFGSAPFLGHGAGRGLSYVQAG